MKKISEAIAPARANLLGEHTDYNQGYVLPTPLPYFTKVQLEQSNDNLFRLRSTAFDEDHVITAESHKTGSWTDYISGCLHIIKNEGHDIPGLSITVDSNIPIGMGVSSSAALTVSMLRALKNMLGLESDDLTIATLAHRVEKDFVGVPCGIMDQMVCSLGISEHALFLDTQSMEMEHVKLPRSHKFCIIHSGITHELKDGDGGYKQRVAECAEACRLLNIDSLREITDNMVEEITALPAPLNKRALHVYTENQRVLDGVTALKQKNTIDYGRLMIESHESQRDNYDVSISHIDTIVEYALKHGATGARLTGGGFGGAVIALVEHDKVSTWWDRLSSDIEGLTLL